MNRVELFCLLVGVRLTQLRGNIQSFQVADGGDTVATSNVCQLFVGATRDMMLATNVATGPMRDAIRTVRRIAENVQTGNVLHWQANDALVAELMEVIRSAVENIGDSRINTAFHLGLLLPWSEGRDGGFDPNEVTEIDRRIDELLPLLRVTREDVFPTDRQNVGRGVVDLGDPSWGPLELSLGRLRSRIEGGNGHVATIGVQPAWVAGPFDLFIDERSRTVRRGTSLDSVQLGPTASRLLARLGAAFPEPVSRQDLADNWREIGLVDVAPSTVTDAIAELREALRPLNLGIRPANTGGFVLEALPAEI